MSIKVGVHSNGIADTIRDCLAHSGNIQLTTSSMDQGQKKKKKSKKRKEYQLKIIVLKGRGKLFG